MRDLTDTGSVAPMTSKRCQVEGCPDQATRDTPVCTTHWRAVDEDLRREWLSIGRRIVRAAGQATDVTEKEKTTEDEGAHPVTRHEPQCVSQGSPIDAWYEPNGCDCMAAEIGRLRAWKREAMEVLSGWEQVYVALGEPGRLGQFKADASLHEVRRLRNATEKEH